MKLSASLTNAANTVGFVTVSGFEGPKAKISIAYLKDAMVLLRKFEEIGYTSETLSIGVTDATSSDGHNVKDMVMLFLDKDQTFGIVLASILQQEGEE